MSALTSAVDDLFALIRGPFTAQHLQQIVQKIVEAGQKPAPLPEIDAALQRLAPLIVQGHAVPAAWFALCCGALIEVGGDPSLPGAEILDRTQLILEQAAAFARTCRPEERKERPEDQQSVAIDKCIQR
jgi:hypothetical protein